MIQLILSGRLPTAPQLKQHCLSNPDMLQELSERASVPDSAVEELADHFSLILHDLRMAGAWKRTNRRRLRQTEEMLCAYIVPRPGRDLVFLDVGASDGVTTVEAVRALRQAFGRDVRAYVADVNLWLLRYRRGPVIEYRASDGEPIMVRVGPIGLRLAKSRRPAAEPDASRLAQRYFRWNGFRDLMRLDARISLVSPLLKNEPGVAVVELDCLRRDPTLVDQISAIRASNILNLGYFERSLIREAVGHFHVYLQNSGCLVISRNVDGPTGETENGSVWIKEPTRFRWVADFGSGSEVKIIVDDWRSNEAPAYLCHSPVNK